MSTPPPEFDTRVGVIISCMVLEHFDCEAERMFMEFSRMQLKERWRMIGLAPVSPSHWDVEDGVDDLFEAANTYQPEFHERQKQ